MDEIRFGGRAAIVTGAGGGLGRAYALELARRGARVVVNDLGARIDGSGTSTSAAEATVAEIHALGGEAVGSYDSVATHDGGAAIVQTCLDAFGGVDVVINNAGNLRDRTFAKLTEEELDAVLAVHLLGAFYVTQPAFRVMKEQGYGRLLFTSSVAGLFGNFGQANYAAAKMGIVGLSNVLAIEGARHNITSNVVAPGARSRLSADLYGDLADSFDPELVAALAVLLVSESNEVTHEIFTVGGGRFARVFLGVGPGWIARAGARPTVEDVRDHLDQILSEDGYVVPRSIDDETRIVLSMFDGRP